MKSILLIGLLIFSIICSADIYMSKDKNGSVSYSDTPIPGSEKIVLPSSGAPSTISAAPITPADNTNNNGSAETSAAIPEQTEPRVPYTQFLIDSPIDQQTITNQQSIPVVLTVHPDLQKGDKTQVYLDGKPQLSPAATTHIELTNMERGTHQLSAVLIDESNNMLRHSQTITIFIHYAHLGTPTNTTSVPMAPTTGTPPN